MRTCIILLVLFYQPRIDFSKLDAETLIIEHNACPDNVCMTDQEVEQAKMMAWSRKHGYEELIEYKIKKFLGVIK